MTILYDDIVAAIACYTRVSRSGVSRSGVRGVSVDMLVVMLFMAFDRGFVFDATVFDVYFLRSFGLALLLVALEAC